MDEIVSAHTGIPSPHDYGQCRYTDCTKVARMNGYCSSHDTTMRRRGESDGVRPGRWRKLTDEQVAELKRMRAAFKSTGEIARHFHISRDTVLRYARGEHKSQVPTGPWEDYG